MINISSVGKTGTPFLAADNASKFAVEGLLRKPCAASSCCLGVDVIVIAPGAVKTQMIVKGVEAGSQRL